MNTDCDKIAYNNHAQASAAVHGMGKRGANMYAYRCTRCGLHHIATAGKKKTPYKKPKYKQQWQTQRKHK